ncbi:MAG: hypothetical protein ACQESF_00755 [Nanobdellota archaeon]
MKKKSHLNALYEKNMTLTKSKIKDSVKSDSLIIQAVSNLTELTRSTNLHSKRLREWYSLYAPEIVQRFSDNRQLVNEVLDKPRKKLLKESGINPSNSMGADLSKEDISPILELAEFINSSFLKIDNLKNYLEVVVKKSCPNMYYLAGSLLGAELIVYAGSIKNLATMTASKIQLLGAEKALFRHLRTGAKAPKHGILLQHQYVANSKNKGKAARHLADNISIAIKVDFFKGEFMGKKLKERLMKSSR